MPRRLKAVRSAPASVEYVIIDDRIKPDAMFSLGGARIYERGGKRYVRMTAGQSQWYLEHKAIALENSEGERRALRAKERAKALAKEQEQEAKAKAAKRSKRAAPAGEGRASH